MATTADLDFDPAPWALVRPDGDLDGEHAGLLLARIEAALTAGFCYLLVDLEGVEQLGDTALGVLTETRNRIADTGELRLSVPSDDISACLDDAGLTSLLVVYSDLDDALEDLPGPLCAES